jgi:transmembrane sensor
MNFDDYKAEDFVCDESFLRYCLGSNDADTSFWENWIGDHPEKQAVVQEAKQLVTVLSAKQGNRLEQLRSLKDGIQQYDMLKEALTERPAAAMLPPRRFTSRPLFRYAAALAVIACLALVVYLFIPPTAPKPQAPQKTSLLFTSGKDPRKTVVLPDGSLIILRRQSVIELDPGFNQANRQLTLRGEAFFDVAHNAQLPFLVHTAMADIKVLGTVFNVSVDKDRRQMEAALFKGSVEVAWKAGPGRKVVLSPNQKLIVGDTIQNAQAATNDAFKIVPLDADPVNHKAKEIAWVRNRLEIENEPLEVIAGKLEKWYGIPVRFADEEVKKYRYSGTFESETVMKALDALQLSYPFSFSMADSVIIISK